MKAIFSHLFLLMPIALFSQTIIPITDNLVVNTGDYIQFEAGTYLFPDDEADGVIQLQNVNDVILEGFGVEGDGTFFNGYFIYLENCNNVVIRGFEMVERYFYAIYAVNCTNVIIEDCTFSNNQRDDAGWIVIFDGPEQAHGGGVFMENCTNVVIEGNAMQYQNDGVALYDCSYTIVRDNNLSWNTSFGVRMWHTHESLITNNDCSHTNRPLTDPSDCASILLLDAFNNTVTYNNCTHSGDGIFLNNYYSSEPANNYFAYNDCSFSPHNAIEAVFSDGNVFKHNTCNYSNYGFWLGYSYNTVVDSNEIAGNGGLDGNGGGGIAIDRGFNNVITHNTLSQNSYGIQLWEGGLIAPYTNESEYYEIAYNLFFGNRLALSLSDTEEVSCEENVFSKNFQDIRIAGNADEQEYSENVFGMNGAFYFENLSPDDIAAAGNFFPDMALPGFFDCKIRDAADDPAWGEVLYLPYETLPPLTVQNTPPNDLCEPPAIWDAYRFVEDGALTTIGWDETEKQEGSASLFLDTESGWDVHLHYFPGEGQHAAWNLDEEGSVTFWMKINITDPNNLWGVQEGFLRIGDACGNYFQYDNPTLFNDAWGQWVSFEIPVSGNADWPRSEHGTVDLTAINYISFNVDVWEYGYELWLDGLTVPVLNTSVDDKPAPHPAIQAFPNPSSEHWNLELDLPEAGTMNLALYDQMGRLVRQWSFSDLSAGYQSLTLENAELPSGVYLLKVFSGKWESSVPVVR